MKRRDLMNRFMLLLALVPLHSARAQVAEVPPFPDPDPRMKADILLIVAHPDDETAVGSFLAKAVFDDRKRVAIIYCNRGTGGGNSAGGEQAASLGAIRETEARQAAAAFGITNVWFLEGRDTPGQDLFASLQSWHHGAILEDVVRFIRLTRPEVVLTWLPHFVAGENHGDHQASGVVATEAFDLAGDPTVFPAQVAVPRERTDIGNQNEGLLPWQPKKLYFFSDASHPLAGAGPAFDMNIVSPAKGEPYYRLAARLHTPHRTQGDVSGAALDALRTGDFGSFKDWLGSFRLIFGKAVVPCKPEGDIFEGISEKPVAFAGAPGYRRKTVGAVRLELGGVFAFYQDFWSAHGIERISGLVRPEIEVAAGSYLFVPLQIWDDTGDTVLVTLTSNLPAGWKETSGSGRYKVPPGATVPAQTFVRCPGEITPAPATLTWKASVGGKEIGSVSMRVKLLDWTLPE